MYVKSSPLQQDAMAEAWTADFLVLGQALYHWATLPPCSDACLCREHAGAAFGKTEWKHLIVADDDVDVRYSKLLSATTQYLRDIIEDERRQLVALLNHEDTQVGTWLHWYLYKPVQGVIA